MFQCTLVNKNICAYMLIFLQRHLSIFNVFTLACSQVCPRRCQCPEEPPMCPPGVPLILDDCACCLVCAAQKGQVCSEMKPCDTRKGLQCDYSVNTHKRTGVCAVNAGNACVLDGSVYQNGQTFFPSCKYQCMCHDGQIACVPRCNLDVMLPGPDCPIPKSQQQSLNGWDPSLNCIVQTTEWGACSETCGMGVSTRVTNKNDNCEMVKQSRLCMIRPCEGLQEQGARCQRTVRSDKAIHLTYKNCTSVQAYKPRFCGFCTDSRCCTPHRTKTALVEFQCAEGKTNRRPVMVILTCVCHSHCPRDNAHFLHLVV
uniref:CCN family member 3 n=1 Tax=Oryzias latipes TaxID=8090 RepID=A0A3P9JVU6_ORYLA